MNKPSLQQKQTLFFVRSSFHCRNKTKRPETAMNYNTLFSISFKWNCMASDHVYGYKRNPPESGKFFPCKKIRYFLLEECRILGFGISIWLKESKIILTIVVWNQTSTKTSTWNLESMASTQNPRLSWIPLYGLNDDFYKHIRYSK